MSRYGMLYPEYDRRPCGPALPPYRPPEDCRPLPSCRPCGCREDTSLRLRLFDCGCRQWDGCRRPLPPAAPPVTIVNPCNCHESVQVTLSVDECGNLVVYVRR
ncbi:MAG: hypothetical protein IJC56_01675 [Clostridia bacterium]|nr:hypothetical protein [Clostridia bacterium]